MCNIIYQPKTLNIKREHFINSAEWNPHGTGVAFPGGDKGIHIIRGMNIDVKTVITLNGIHRDSRPVVTHFRYATKGAKILDNCHPFELLTRAEDGFALVGFHNGTIKQIDAKEELSDTNLFFSNYLKPLLKQDRTLIHKYEFQVLLSQILGYNNKMLFLDEQGNVVIINKIQGIDLISENKPSGWASTAKYLEVKPYNVNRTGEQSSSDKYYPLSPLPSRHTYQDRLTYEPYQVPYSTRAPTRTHVAATSVKNPALDIWEIAKKRVGWRKARSQSKAETIESRRNQKSFERLFSTTDGD